MLGCLSNWGNYLLGAVKTMAVINNNSKKDGDKTQIWGSLGHRLAWHWKGKGILMGQPTKDGLLWDLILFIQRRRQDLPSHSSPPYPQAQAAGETISICSLVSCLALLIHQAQHIENMFETRPEMPFDFLRPWTPHAQAPPWVLYILVLGTNCLA